MLKLVVFDWDGTLADSVSKIVACKQFLARKYKLPSPSESAIKKVLGMKFEDALKICFPTATLPVLSKLASDFHVLMQQTAYQAVLFPHAKNILKNLKSQNYKLAVATAKSRTELDSALIYNGLMGVFDATCCSSEHQAKPNPAMLKHLMNEFKAQPDECLMIGDTITDIMFAHNADVKIVCVTFGAHPAPKLKAMSPLALIDNWLQLNDIINNIKAEKCYQPQQLYCRL